MNLGINQAYNLLVDKLSGWLNTAIKMLPNLVAAILILVVFYGLGWLIRKAVSRALNKVTNNKAVIGLLETIAGVVVIAAGIFVALGVLNLDGTVTSLLAGVGVIGLALGFAFQDIAANLMAGIIVSIRRPFVIGGLIESKGYYGYVNDVNLRCTMVRTTQGQLVYIPNKDLLSTPFTNYTWNKERRIDLSCGVSYADDLEKVQKLGIETIQNLDFVLDSRPVQLVFKTFGGSSIDFDLRFWVRFEKNFDFKDGRSEAIIALKKAFDENDIDIPWPIRSVEFGVKGGNNLADVLGEQSAESNGSTAG